MPSISGGKNGESYIVWDYNDWTAGLNKQYSTSPTDVPVAIAGNGISTASRFNPFRYYGYASPGFQPTDVGNVSVVLGYIANMALSAQSGTSYGYAIDVGSTAGKLHRLDITNITFTNAGAWPHTIVGAGTTSGNDVCAYTCNVGGTPTPCVFYSWEDSNGASSTWNIGRFRTDTEAFDDDFMSTVPASPITPGTNPAANQKPHPMWVGANDILYFFDGNKVHAYDGATGADGTCSSSVLTLPNGYIGTAFAPYDNGAPFLVCFAYYSPVGNSTTLNTTSSTKSTAFFYDYLSLDPTRAVELNDRAVSAAFAYKGTIGCFTEGNNVVNDGADRNSRLKIYNGVEFETKVTFEGDAPAWGGVDVVGDSVQWTAGGNIFCYGVPFEGLDNKFNALGGGAGTSRGVLRTIGGTTGYQVVSTGATTSGGLQYMKAGTYDPNTVWSTNPALPVFNWGYKGQVKSVRVEFAKTSGGATSTRNSLNLSLVYEGGSTSQILSSLRDVTTSNIEKEYQVTSSNGQMIRFNELRVTGSYSAGATSTECPIIKRIVVTYIEVGIVGT